MGKKICMIIHSLGIGGMERVMSILATNFSKRRDVIVHLVLIGKKREIKYSIPDEVRIHKPRFEFSNSRRSTDTLRTILFLRSEIKSINPDVVLSFGEMWNNLALMALYGLKLPVFVSDRSKPGKDLGKLHNYLRSKLYPKASGYIAQTKAAGSICLSEKWNNNVCVIGNPIRNIKSDESIKKENIVLTVGRLIKTKHVDQLIKMFVDINKPGWKLVIVGGDAKKMNLSRELNDLIIKLDAANSVFLEGEQQEIDKYYNKSKIFAFTSSSEGFPNVVGEALSAGLPVVAYDCIAGPSDLIDNGNNGFLVKLNDQESFKKKLSHLMNDDEMRRKMRENAISVIKKFDKNKIADNYLDFIC